MAQRASNALSKVMDMLTSTESLPVALAAVAMEAGVATPPLGAAQIRAQNVTAELAERSSTMRYPCLFAYCERITNNMREKFRTFSGTARMVVEIRNSQDRLDGLEDQLRLFSDAVGRTLENNRGDWGDGVFYPGGYEVTFSAVRPGGKSFLQVAKASFDLEISY